MGLRIAVNARLILPHRMEGVARYILETAQRMVTDHPEAEFHFYFDRPVKIDSLKGDNVFYHVLRPPARHPILWYIWFEWVLAKAMQRDKIDVFYSGESYLSLRSNVPCLMVSHDINYYHYPSHIIPSHLRYFRYYFPRFHRKAEQIVAVSEFTKTDIINAYDLAPEKITVAYNAAPDGFHPLDENEKMHIKSTVTGGKDYFIYVGSLHPRKNVANLIKAFNIFKAGGKKEHKLVIFGRFAFRTSNIFTEYRQSPWMKDILFLSNDDIAVSQILGAATALCYVSLFEGFGIPILEAFHAEVPVITSNVSSMPEVAGDAALLVYPEDPKDIARAMLAISNDSEIGKTLINKGRQRKSDFSWQQSSEIIWNGLQEVYRKQNTAL